VCLEFKLRMLQYEKDIKAEKAKIKRQEMKQRLNELTGQSGSTKSSKTPSRKSKSATATKKSKSATATKKSVKQMFFFAGNVFSRRDSNHIQLVKIIFIYKFF